MKIVIISGSPRKNANTQIMMRHVFEYTKSKNVDTKFINLSEDGFDYYHGFLNEVEYGENINESIIATTTRYSISTIIRMHF